MMKDSFAFSTVSDFLRAQIHASGPMDLGAFMALALGHPTLGYYMTRDPLGRAGDFTTAPEISQMFGEIMGAWAVDLWEKLGRPDPFALVECGPGRGTLMADALRVTAKVPGFHAALRLYLVEMSPVLKAKQKEALRAFAPIWLDQLEDLPEDRPFILLANEFLDALPVHQIVKLGVGGGADSGPGPGRREGWAERVVALRSAGEDKADAGNGGKEKEEKASGEFVLTLRSPAPENLPPLVCFDAEAGDIAEVSPERLAFVRAVCRRLKTQTGAALFVDYGYDRAAAGESVQAVKDHAFVPVLNDVGNADLTAHVDFGAILGAAKGEGVSVSGPVGQGDFLRRLGIGARAAALARAAQSLAQAREIETALDRLVHPARMGGLFRVVALYEGITGAPEGFA